MHTPFPGARAPGYMISPLTELRRKTTGKRAANCICNSCIIVRIDKSLLRAVNYIAIIMGRTTLHGLLNENGSISHLYHSRSKPLRGRYCDRDVVI